MLPPEFIYQLKAANPIETVISQYIELKRTGNLMAGVCPFHGDKNPSLMVYYHSADPHYFCFGCHAGGDVITFIRQIEGLGYMDAVQFLADRAGLTVPQDDVDQHEARMRTRILELNRAAARFYYEQLCGPDKRGLQYLAGRALMPQTVRKYGLGYAGYDWDALYQAMRAKGYTDLELEQANLCVRSEKTGSYYDRFRGRVIFPIIDIRGNVVAFGGRTIEPDGVPKYLNSSDTPVFKKGRTLFSIHFAKKSQSKRMILAEGYLDVITIHQAGFDNVVASLGTALTPGQCHLMKQYCSEVILSYDSDAAGQAATRKAAMLLRDAGIQPRILQIPDAKDPDEFIKKFGAGRFRLLLDEAQDAIEFLLDCCKNSADLVSSSGMIDALHQAADVLATLSNEMERNVYLSYAAKSFDVDPRVLSGEVQKILAGRSKHAQYGAWKAASSRPLLPNRAIPAEVQHRRETKAEKQILCYLFRNPDALKAIAARISPAEFIDDIYRRTYVLMQEAAQQGLPFDLSLYGEQFTPLELGEITGITAEFDDIETITPRSVEDCIAVLQQYQQNEKPVEEQSDEEWAASFQQIKSRKHSGTK